jgi:membrane associated rhomboid family serine protease
MNIILTAIVVTALLVSKVLMTNLLENTNFIWEVFAGEQIRLISSGFLHADISHLAFNMITFYFFLW